MIIAIDIDGTLLDIHTPWLAKYNKISGDNLQPKDIKCYYFGDVVKPAYSQSIYSMRTPDLYDYATPIPGAQCAIEKLKKDHQLVIISHDSAKFARYKADAIREYFQVNDIVFAKEKSCVRYDILIDDNPKNNPDILFHQPWNSYAATRVGCYRANGWGDVVFAVKHIDWRIK